MQSRAHHTRYELLRATLVSPGFVIALTLLIANDFWLKQAWPGFVTGKLSDFAGIAVVTWLALAWVRGRTWMVYACIAMAFTWWKSPFSQAFIENVNALLPWPIARVVDFTDLIALSIVPLCGHAARSIRQLPRSPRSLRRWVVPPIAIVTSCALMATSMPVAREVFQIRQQLPDAALDPKAIFSSVSAVAESHGLKCQDCATPLSGATFAGKGIVLRYTLTAPDTLCFAVHAGGEFPFGKTAFEKSDPLIGDLKRRLMSTHRGLILIQELDPSKAAW